MHVHNSYKILIYIAGPYTKGNVEENVKAAMEAAHQLMDAGFAPYCPHLTHFLHLHRNRPYDEWLSLDDEWLIMCDGVWRLLGESSGADRECRTAQSLAIPVFHSIDDIISAFKY